MRNSAKNTLSNSIRTSPIYLGLGLLFLCLNGVAQVSGELVFVHTTIRSKPYLAKFIHKTDSNQHFKSLVGVEYSLRNAQIKKVNPLLNDPKNYPAAQKTGIGHSFIPGSKSVEVSVGSYFAAPQVTYQDEYFWVGGGSSFLGIQGIPIYGLNFGYIFPQTIGKNGHLGLSVSYFNLYFPRFSFPGIAIAQIGYSTGNHFRSHTFAGGFITLPNLDNEDEFILSKQGIFRYSYYSMRKHNRGTLLDVMFISTPVGLFPTINYARRYWHKKWHIDLGISFLSPLSLVSPILPYFAAGYRFGNGHRRKIPDENSYWGY
ncbi:MAG: hypothetical protein ACI9YL_002114 [Luteibaculaceae bacterium]|jgi:hypothetical protein